MITDKELEDMGVTRAVHDEHMASERAAAEANADAAKFFAITSRRHRVWVGAIILQERCPTKLAREIIEIDYSSATLCILASGGTYAHMSALMVEDMATGEPIMIGGVAHELYPGETIHRHGDEAVLPLIEIEVTS